MLARSLVSSSCLTLCIGCFASPDPEDGEVYMGSGGIQLDGSDGAPYEPTGSSGIADTGSESAVDEADGSTDDGMAASTDTTSAAEAGESTDGGDPWDEGDVPNGFPVREPFGDDVRELDLVGHWTMPWEPIGVPDVELSIEDDGSFVWHERAADCSDVGIASGTMWVSYNQLVMHFDDWDKPPAWETEPELGVEIEPPYRMRLGYTPMGGFLGISAPEGLTATGDWSGRGYVRIDGSTGPTGSWAAESELWAVPPGEGGPQLIVRDRFDAQLGSGGAHLGHTSSWWWPEQAARPSDDVNGPWSDTTPGYIAGEATVLGVRHAYDATGLFAFTADRSFKLGVSSDCD